MAGPSDTKFDPAGIKKAIDHLQQALDVLQGGSVTGLHGATQIRGAFPMLLGDGGEQIQSYYQTRAEAVIDALGIQGAAGGTQNAITMLQNTLVKYGDNEATQSATADSTGQAGGEG